MTTAVIFDLDGTLVNTEAEWDRIRRGLAAAQGLPWPDSATTDQMGMATQQWSAYMVERVGVAGTPEEVADQVIDEMVALYRRGLDVLPGAIEVVHRMAARGPIGLASSSPRILIDTALEVMGVSRLFGATCSTAEVGGRGKPDPAAFLTVAADLGVAPGNCVVVEDSTNGVLAGHRAGMKVIAIPQPFHPPAPHALDLADAVLDRLDELTDDLLDRLFR